MPIYCTYVCVGEMCMPSLLKNARAQFLSNTFLCWFFLPFPSFIRSAIYLHYYGVAKVLPPSGLPILPSTGAVHACVCVCVWVPCNSVLSSPVRCIYASLHFAASCFPCFSFQFCRFVLHFARSQLLTCCNNLICWWQSVN